MASAVKSKLAVLVFVLTTACSMTETVPAPSPSATEQSPATVRGFDEYQEATLQQIRLQRSFRSLDTDSELSWNGPREWLPAGLPRGVRPRKGILLVHGLGDSPWSFIDLAPALAKQGFLVRTVLLPGHGTRPDDLLNVSVEDWRRVVREQAGAMRLDVDKVYLGGFSTGANLVLEYAYENADVAGLALFSPGFKSLSLDWLAPALARVRPWIIRPDADQPLHNTVRYMTVPTNGFAQFYHSSRTARRLLADRSYEKPVFMAVAEHDSVLDTKYLLRTFQNRFTHPDSRLIWYGNSPSGVSASRRIFVRSDNIPDLRISQFSHMGLLFSPSNPLYGAEGSLRICLNGLSAVDTRACDAGAPVWFSDWGYSEKGKIHARLTFNPYFEWQASVVKLALEDSDSGPIR